LIPSYIYSTGVYNIQSRYWTVTTARDEKKKSTTETFPSSLQQQQQHALLIPFVFIRCNNIFFEQVSIFPAK
jgi:hypothetical protein